MEIKSIKMVGDTYRSEKGNDYAIVKLKLGDIDEDLADIRKPVMYGTIPIKDIDEATGKLTRKVYLLAMCPGETIPDAIEMREFSEATEGKTVKEAIEWFVEGRLNEQAAAENH